MKTSTKAGVLGAADGVTSISGVVAGGAAAGIGHAALAVTAIGGALAATVSMAGAELLSEDTTDWEAVLAMAAGTVIGAAAPAVPLVFVAGTAGWAAVTVVSIAVAVAVGEVRYRAERRGRTAAYLLTGLVLACGAAIGWLAGALL